MGVELSSEHNLVSLDHCCWMLLNDSHYLRLILLIYCSIGIISTVNSTCVEEVAETLETTADRQRRSPTLLAISQNVFC